MYTGYNLLRQRALTTVILFTHYTYMKTLIRKIWFYLVTSSSKTTASCIGAHRLAEAVETTDWWMQLRSTITNYWWSLEILETLLPTCLYWFTPFICRNYNVSEVYFHFYLFIDWIMSLLVILQSKLFCCQLSIHLGVSSPI